MVKTLPEFHKVLLDLCHASVVTPDEGCGTAACVKLIEELMAEGPEQFLEFHTQTPGTNEYRLNGDSLKLRYDVEYYRDGENTRVYVGKFAIAGDQAAAYPAFSRAANLILQPADTAGPDRTPSVIQ